MTTLWEKLFSPHPEAEPIENTATEERSDDSADEANISTMQYASNSISNMAVSMPFSYGISGQSGTGTGSGGGYSITTGSSGHTLMSGAGGTLTWGNVVSNSTAYAPQEYYIQTNMKVEGNADFSGDIKIRGKSLSEMLDTIEQRLAILHPNVELEDKWSELKTLGEQYRALEQDILEKEKMWDILKK